MKSRSSNSIVVKGRVIEGLKKSSFFTRLPWAREQFMSKLGIDPYPGTLNLEIVNAQDLETLKRIDKQRGVEIIPGEPGFCSGRCYRVLVCGRVKGALVVPQLPEYPESKLEIISSDRIRDVLSLEVGDIVEVEIL
jgi:riboflavin kinase